jgi:multicomponent K+:H+ antiporter subunit G
MADLLISVLLVIGGVFGLIGSYGLLKLDDPMRRLHAPTKASTVGLGTVLIASMAYFWAFRSTVTWHEALIVLFLFVTSPITANYLSKVHMHRSRRPEDLPPTGTGQPWATYDTAAPSPDKPRQDG